MGALPKGTVIFNEEQTEQIMQNKGEVVGNAYAKGTPHGEDKITYLPDGTAVFPMSMKVLPNPMIDPTIPHDENIYGKNGRKVVHVHGFRKDLSESARNISRISGAVNNNNSTMNRNAGRRNAMPAFYCDIY